MWLFDLFSNFNRKLDAIISYDARRNAWKVLITSSIATRLSTLELSLTKINDDDEWIDSFLYAIEYENEDDEAGLEYKEINLELTPGLPYSLDFSLTTIREFTLEKVRIYYEEALHDGTFEEEDMESFFSAFLDPKWKMEVSVDDISLGEIEFEYQSSEITEYIESLQNSYREKGIETEKSEDNEEEAI